MLFSIGSHSLSHSSNASWAPACQHWAGSAGFSDARWAPPFASLALVWETLCHLVTTMPSFARNTYHLYCYLCSILICIDLLKDHLILSNKDHQYNCLLQGFIELNKLLIKERISPMFFSKITSCFTSALCSST